MVITQRETSTAQKREQTLSLLESGPILETPEMTAASDCQLAGKCKLQEHDNTFMYLSTAGKLDCRGVSTSSVVNNFTCL